MKMGGNAEQAREATLTSTKLCFSHQKLVFVDFGPIKHITQTFRSSLEPSASSINLNFPKSPTRPNMIDLFFPLQSIEEGMSAHLPPQRTRLKSLSFSFSTNQLHLQNSAQVDMLTKCTEYHCNQPPGSSYNDDDCI